MTFHATEDETPAAKGEATLASLRQSLRELRQDEGSERRAGRAEFIIGALATLGGGAGFVSHLGPLLVAWAKMDRTDRPAAVLGKRWSIGEAKRDFTGLVEAASHEPQFVMNMKSADRPTMVMFEAEAVERFAQALEAMALPQYATGAEMAEALVHDRPPSRMVSLARRPTQVARRHMPKDNLSAPDPELRPRRSRVTS